MVLAGGQALGRHTIGTIYSYVHTHTAHSTQQHHTSLNEHLGGRCGVGVVVIKYETKNDFYTQNNFLTCFSIDTAPPGRALRGGPSLVAAQIRTT